MWHFRDFFAAHHRLIRMHNLDLPDSKIVTAAGFFLFFVCVTDWFSFSDSEGQIIPLCLMIMAKWQSLERFNYTVNAKALYEKQTKTKNTHWFINSYSICYFGLLFSFYHQNRILCLWGYLIEYSFRAFTRGPWPRGVKKSYSLSKLFDGQMHFHFSTAQQSKLLIAFLLCKVRLFFVLILPYFTWMLHLEVVFT